MQLLYTIFILPLESLMKLVLDAVLSSAGSPVLSLIAVSLVVSLGSLPLYHLAEQWQDNERDIQKKLRHKLSEFKSVFKGAELNAYIHTLYRQNNYHPIYAVRTSFGFLIQIPFFFAAYHLLSNYEAFNGVSAFIFKDLNEPDALIKIGVFSINTMPFVMTIVNIGSAFVYGAKLHFKEKFQLYTIAAIFLLVLYNSTSALLFYWTCNNIFSLIKNIAYRFMYTEGRLNLKISDQKSSKDSWLTLIIKTVAGFKPDIWTQIVLLIVAIAVYVLGVDNNLGSTKSFWSLFIVVSIFSLLSMFVIINLLKNFKEFAFMSIISMGIAVTGAVFTSLWLFEIKDILPNRVWSFYISGFLPFAALINSLFSYFINLIENYGLTVQKSRALFFTLALSVSGLLLFFAGPLTLLSSGGVGEFPENILFYLSHMLMYFVTYSMLAVVIYSFAKESTKTLIIYILTLLSFYTLINGFVFPGNYGDMSKFIFEKGVPVKGLYNLTNIIVLSVITVLAVWTISKKRHHIFISALTVCFIALTVLMVKEGRAFQKIQSASLWSRKQKESAKLHKDFVFSKKHKNVLIIMLDRFIGGYAGEAFKLDPGLKKHFTGFKWYSNTLSDGAFTIVGVPSILGGWDYSAHEIHHSRTDVPVLKKLDETLRILPYNFMKAGYQATMYPNVLPWLNKKDKKYIKNVKYEVLNGKYQKIWLEQHNRKINNDDVLSRLTTFGFFRVAPPVIRKNIYDDGRWLSKKNVKKKDIIGKNEVSFQDLSSARKKASSDGWSTLEYLPKISKISNDAKGQFYYLSDLLTHEPYFTTADFKIDLENRIKYPRKIYDKFGEDIYSLQHLYTDAAALKLLGRWFEWMKRNGVYDNTRIIIVSDHGRNVHDPVLKQQTIKESKNNGKTESSWFNNVLLFKDFNKTDPLTTDSSFMTTCDVPYLATKNIIKAVNPFTGNPIIEKKNKSPFYVYKTPPMTYNIGKYKYKVYETFSVPKGTEMDPSTWKKYDDK